MRQPVRRAGPKLIRCAIYTRKSTDHNLDLEFNSLDAQREASEAYIKSQAHEGWRLIPDRFDDGAFSGASLDRPALQALMNMIRAKQVDVIVVYKVDRLTRSLADFAKLVELFDANDVSFVSVTQSFNTTSSMGRLTLNVLLSFAQFEREVIGERVRDKIAASKKKGLWVGGPIPLGYASQDKKLVVVPEEAEIVRLIFTLYLQLGSIRILAQELRRRQIRTKPQLLTTGRTRGGGAFSVGPLRYLLKNRFYIGEVLYRGEIYPGEHDPILERGLFEAVQQKLADQAVARRISRSTSSAILTGLIFDDRGNRMTPSHANKRGVRYRYYTSQALIQGRTEDTGTISRVCAPDIERIVLEGLRGHLATLEDNTGLRAIRRAPGANGRSEAGRELTGDRHRGSGDQLRQPGDWRNQTGSRPLTEDGRNQANDRQLIDDHVEKIVVRPKTIDVVLGDADIGQQQGRTNLPMQWTGRALSEEEEAQGEDRNAERDEDRNTGYQDREGETPVTLVLPWSAPNQKPKKGVLREPAASSESGAMRAPLSEQMMVRPSAPRQLTPPARDALLLAIAKARRWVDDLASGRAQSFAEIAARENKVERHIRFLAPLAFVSPRIVFAIATGEAPDDLTVTALAKALPPLWAEQETAFERHPMA